MFDRSTLLAVEAGEPDEQVGDSRVGIPGKGAWGFRKITWIGGACFVGTVICAFAFKWSSAAKPPVPHPVTMLQVTEKQSWSTSRSWLCADDDAQVITIASGLNLTKNGCADTQSYCEDPTYGTIMQALCPATCGICTVVASSPTDAVFLLLKGVRSGLYLHVPSESMSIGEPVAQINSTTNGSEWQVERVGSSGSIIMLQSVRSGYYLHVPSQGMSNGGRVVHSNSTTDGSKWRVEHVGNSDSMIMLKSVRSGFYLHEDYRVSPQDVVNADSASDGSKWLLEWQGLPTTPGLAPRQRRLQPLSPAPVPSRLP